MKESAYKQAGVDIEAGAELVKKIGPMAAATNRSGVMEGLGGFGCLFDLPKAGYKDPILVSATDGVGTKLKIAIDTNQHTTVGIDLVAMCVNDLIVQGAEPLFFLDYFASGKLDTGTAADVIDGIAKGCKQAGCALIGGETAEMPGMYSAGDYDLAGFAVGAVERNRMINGTRIQDGDIVLGLASSGVHSNGYSLVRRLIDTTQGVTYESPAPFDNTQTVGQAFLTPTRIYALPILKALQESDQDDLPLIKGMAHITGGGLLENIPRVLPEGLGVELDAASWPLLPMFKWLKEVGQLDDKDMAQTFNCGIGYVVICSPDAADTLHTILQNEGESVYRIGTVTQTNADERVTINNCETAWAN